LALGPLKFYAGMNVPELLVRLYYCLDHVYVIKLMLSVCSCMLMFHMPQNKTRSNVQACFFYNEYMLKSDCFNLSLCSSRRTLGGSG
jgi:hypothetical protein